MTKQEIQALYGQSIYEIQMGVATKAFALMVSSRPIQAEFQQMAVTALNAATEFSAIVLGNPGPTIEPQGDRTLEDGGEPQRQAWSGAGHRGRSPQNFRESP